MSDTFRRYLTCGAMLALSACAPAKPEQKPVVDEFQGFAALRGEPREKKKPAKEEDEKPAEGEPAKGEEKTALNKEQVLSAIGTAQKRVDGCLKKLKDPGIYVMQITIDPAGSCAVEPMRAPTRKEEPTLWTDVEPGIDGGHNPKSPTNKCLATALSTVKFPTFEGKPLVVTYPLILR